MQIGLFFLSVLWIINGRGSLNEKQRLFRPSRVLE